MKYVIISLLFFVTVVDMRRPVYYPASNDPNAIVFPEPTNQRKPWSNDIDDDFNYNIDIRFGTPDSSNKPKSAEENSAESRQDIYFFTD